MRDTSRASDNPFARGGSEYAQYRPSYPASLADSLADLCYSQTLALEVGCGTGQLSQLLAERFSKVIATDASQDQIDQALPQIAIDYRCEPAEQISIGRASADLIVDAQAAHWFDLSSFYRELGRVAVPGAVIALLSYGVLSIEGELDSRFQQFYWQEIHRFWPPERRHVETGYADFDFPFDEVPLKTLFIEREWNLAQLIGYVNTWSAAKNALRERAGSIVAGFELELAESWGDPGRTRRIRWPIVGRVGMTPK